MAAKRTGGLGRGLDALIPAKNKSKNGEVAERTEEKKQKTSSEMKKPKKKEESAREKIKNTESPEIQVILEEPARKPEEEKKNQGETVVKLSSVEPNRAQPRKRFNEDALVELSDSIKKYGVIQPLLVSNKGDFYEIIAGERRWRAAKMAGLKEIPVIVKELTDQEAVEISLIENIQREDLNPIEEAKAYKRLMDEYQLKQDEIAERVSKSRTTITNSMRLLKLDDRVSEMLIDEMISAGHARALLALPTGEAQVQVATKIFDEKLSVRETEKLVKSLLKPQKEKPAKEINETEKAIYENLEEKMKGILGTKVMINPRGKHKGRIEIEYYSEQELERLIDLIESIR